MGRTLSQALCGGMRMRSCIPWSIGILVSFLAGFYLSGDSRSHFTSRTGSASRYGLSHRAALRNNTPSTQLSIMTHDDDNGVTELVAVEGSAVAPAALAQADKVPAPERSSEIADAPIVVAVSPSSSPAAIVVPSPTASALASASRVPPAAPPPPPSADTSGLTSSAACHASAWTMKVSDKWANAMPLDPVLVAARSREPVPTDEDLRDTAIVTMASGDEAARGATVLMQSLRDVGTRVPNLFVMLFRGGHGSKWCDDYPRKDARGRVSFGCARAGPTGSIAEEIVWPDLLLAWERMGVQYQVMEPIPDTNWTQIAGGRGAFWGLAFNKLRVFHLKQFRKIIWMDSDTMVFHNVDHLMLKPMLTAAYTQECALENSGAKTSGGLWVLEPSDAIYSRLERMFSGPVPGSDPPVGWHFGDMQVVMYVFGQPYEAARAAINLPYSWDLSIGRVPGQRAFQPRFRAMDDAQFEEYLKRWMPAHVEKAFKGGFPPEGTLPEAIAKAEQAGHYAWRILDVRYDALVGNCHANNDGRDIGPDFYSVHFSCMPTNPYMRKPATYTSERALMEILLQQEPCVRYYTMRWYETYRRATGARFPAPYFEGDVDMTSPPVRP